MFIDIPIGAIEDIIDWEEIPEEMAKRGECFALMIRGDSMTPRIEEGDVIIVRKQSDVDSGILLSYSLMDLRLLASKL